MTVWSSPVIENIRIKPKIWQLLYSSEILLSAMLLVHLNWIEYNYFVHLAWLSSLLMRNNASIDLLIYLNLLTWPDNITDDWFQLMYRSRFWLHNCLKCEFSLVWPIGSTGAKWLESEFIFAYPCLLKSLRAIVDDSLLIGIVLNWLYWFS